MSGFGNKNVHKFAHFILISAPKSYCWAGMPNLQARTVYNLYYSIGKYIGVLEPLLNGVPLFKYANISSAPSFVVERKPHL